MMRSNKVFGHCFSIVIGLLLCHSLAVAQEYEFEVYDVDDGLLSQDISDIVEDSSGRLLVSTGRGAYGFDGYGFKAIKCDSPVRVNWIWFIEKDTRGNSWVLTSAATLYSVIGNRIFPHPANDTLYALFGNDYSHSSFGFIEGDTIIIGFNRRRHYAKVAPDGNVKKVALKDDNAMLARSTLTGYIFGSIGHARNSPEEAIIKIDNEIITCNKQSGFRRTLAIRVGESLLVVNNRDAFLVSNGKVEKHIALPASALCLSTDQFNNVWIGYDNGGVERWNPDMTALLSKTLEGESCCTIYEDREGNMWFGSRNGLFKMIERTISHYNEFEGGKIASPDAPLFVNVDSALWMRTNHGIVYLDNTELGRMDFERMPNNDCQISNDGFVIHNGDGIYQRNGNKLCRISPQGKYRSHFIEPDEGLWTFQGSNLLKFGNGGEILFSGDDSVENWAVPQELTTSGEVYFRDDEGYLWMEIGLYMYRLKGTDFIKVDPKQHEVDLMLILDGKLVNGIPWVASTYGLWAFAEDSTYYWGEELQSRRCEYVVKESDSAIWVLGQTGATRVGFTVVDGKLNYNITRLNSDNGLKTSGTNDARYYNGAMWFSTKYGISRLEVDQWIRKKAVSPLITIRGVIDEKTQLNVLDGSRLAYDHNNLSVRFLGYTYVGHGRPAYTYRLLGADTNWYVTSDTSVQFSGLTPGHYQFEVEVTNAHGMVSSEPATCTFSIAPPFWKTGGFVVGVIVLLQLIIGGITLSISRAKRKALLSEKDALEAELKTIRMQVNPHFMYNALNNIREMVAQGDHEKAPDQILKFSRLMRRILNATRKKYISLAEEVEVLRAYLEFAQVRFEGKVEYSIDIDSDVQRMMDVLNIPPLLTQPIVENALIHGASKSASLGEVEVKISRLNDYINLQIIDNGPGIHSGTERQKEHQSAGIGLIKEQIDKLNTTLEHKIEIVLTSAKQVGEKAIGTCVTIKVPVELY